MGRTDCDPFVRTGLLKCYIIYQYLRPKLVSRASCSKVEFTTNQPLQEARNEHFSTFTMHTV